MPGLARLAAPRSLALVAWLGPVTVALAYWLYVAGLRRLTAATAATLSLAEPLVATALGIGILREHLSLPIAAGTPVLQADGTSRRIEDLPLGGGSRILAPSGDGRLALAHPTELMAQGMAECVSLVLQDGRGREARVRKRGRRVARKSERRQSTRCAPLLSAWLSANNAPTGMAKDPKKAAAIRKVIDRARIDNRNTA